MEELRKLMIETNVDKLLELVESRGKITTNECSALLNVQESIIEEWAEILSKHRLLEIDYRMKYTLLKSKKLSQKEEKMAVKGLKKEHMKVGKESKAIMRKLGSLEKDILRSDRFVKNVGKHVDKRLITIQKKSQRIGADERNVADKEIDDIKRVENELAKRIGGLRDRISVLTGGKIDLESQEKGIVEVEERIKTLRNNAKSLEMISKVLEKKVRKIRPAEMKGVKKHLIGIRKKSDELHEKKEGVKRKFFKLKKEIKK